MVDANIHISPVAIEAVDGGGVVDQLVSIEFALAEQGDGGLGLDLGTELIRTETVVADELDLFDPDSWTFHDLEDEKACIMQSSFVNGDFGEVVALFLIQVLDAQQRLFDEKIVARSTWVEGDLVAQFLVGNQRVSHCLDVTNKGLFSDRVRDLHAPIGEEFGIGIHSFELAESVERGDVVTESLGIKWLPCSGSQVVADQSLTDSGETFDGYLGDWSVGKGVVIDFLKGHALPESPGSGDWLEEEYDHTCNQKAQWASLRHQPSCNSHRHRRMMGVWPHGPREDSPCSQQTTTNGRLGGLDTPAAVARWPPPRVCSDQCAKNEPNGSGDHCQADKAIRHCRPLCVFTCVGHSVPSSLGAAKAASTRKVEFGGCWCNRWGIVLIDTTVFGLDQTEPLLKERFGGLATWMSEGYRAAMTETNTKPLLRTPLHDFQVEHGAKMVEYAGWELPMLYDSIVAEHRQTRQSGSLFDVSHMGRLRISGRHARKFLDRVCTRKILGTALGQCRYSLICNETGGCLDDVLVYCFAEDDYMVVCNGANRAKIVAHFEAVKAAEDLVFKLKDETESTCMCAMQGPKVMDVIGKVSTEVPTLKRYRFTVKNVLVMKIIVSRTGYTGEDGVEVILGAKFAKQALTMMLKDVSSDDAVIRPAGLGARDSLRLEAGMPLYGHELDEATDPISAGLEFAVALDKGATDEREGRFIGQDALEKIASEGPGTRLVGLKLDGRRSPRKGMVVSAGSEAIGVLTSGCLSPTLQYPIAMAYVPPMLRWSAPPSRWMSAEVLRRRS